MKGAIFLLALCAIQTVFADFKEDLDILNTVSIRRMGSVVQKLHNDVEAAIIDGMRNGLNEELGECRKYYINLEGLYRYRLEVNISSCYFIAARIQNMKSAKKCYNKNIAKVFDDQKRERRETIKCFEKFYEEQLGLKSGQHPRIPL